ncbi:MAG: hypothetical protein ACI4R6_01420 [Lachnospiraceae bacterium]
MADRLRMIDGLINSELEAANKIHPPFVDMHQAYAVMLEEYEETLTEIDSARELLRMHWTCTRNDDFESGRKCANQILIIATRGIAEMVQLAAMAQKAMAVEGGEDK